ncbi:Ig-like domain-containing protein, partial [Serratia bockelmannii]|uniref:Ig-like domain-containing protein n=1 Tax=Serratia bockelmannii TaxID=2703793 RepID=UPI002362A6A0
SAVGNLEVPIELKADETPDGTQSTFAAPNPASITADGTSTSALSFTAKDANGNLISGLTGITFEVKDSSGNVMADGSGVTVSATTDAGEGVYTATLSGTLADTYTVTPQNNGAPVGSLSNTVTLKAGDTPDGTLSTFSVDKAGIEPDGEDAATLTFTAKDLNDNAITDLNALTFAVTPASPDVTVSTVTNVGDGSYTATLKGTAAGTYTLTPQHNGSAVGSLSETVTIAATATAVEGVLVNGYTFAADAGFPKTGFTGAKFTVQLNGGEATDYTWTSTATWAPVDANGNVTFTGKGDSTAVTITATSKVDPSKAFAYTFTLNDWYINNGSTTMTWSAANTYCTNQGAALATRLQLGGTQMTSGLYNVRGTVDSLWSEWGDLTKYTGSGFPSSNGPWTSEVYLSGSHHYIVRLTAGHVTNGSDSDSWYVACRQGL